VTPRKVSTMQDLPQHVDDIKAIVRECTGTPTEKLVAVLMACGVSGTKDLADMIGIDPRSVRRAKKRTPASAQVGHQRPSKADTSVLADRTPESACGHQRPGRARVEDNNLTTNLETKVSTNPPPYSPPPSPPLDWRTAFADADLQAGVEVRNGEAVLVNGTHAAWLARFGGDATRLDLAMIEARAALQPNSRQPIKLQIERVLARIAGQKRDSDQRYASAAKHRQGSQQGSADVLPFRVSPETVRYARPAEEPV